MKTQTLLTSRSMIRVVGLLLLAGVHSHAHRALASGCSDRNIAASAVRTQGDIRAFVECAEAYLAENGTAEARRAFNEDERWKHGPTYVFVDGIARPGADSKTFVYPPDTSREGQPWGEAIDDFGNDLFYEVYRMMQAVDSGWIYYSIPNPATGKKGLKASYVIEIDWNGNRAAIGAGIYARDFPGTCDPSEVTAEDLAANQGDQRLQEFVRCAAMTVESSGYFAGPVLSADPRWKDGPIYIFGINTETGNVEFSGNPAIFATSVRIPDLLFDGRDATETGALFGETFWYYNFNNPSTGEVETKVAYRHGPRGPFRRRNRAWLGICEAWASVWVSGALFSAATVTEHSVAPPSAAHSDSPARLADAGSQREPIGSLGRPAP